jgi:hypothetical protein
VLHGAAHLETLTIILVLFQDPRPSSLPTSYDSVSPEFTILPRADFYTGVQARV